MNLNISTVSVDKLFCISFCNISIDDLQIAGLTIAKIGKVGKVNFPVRQNLIMLNLSMNHAAWYSCHKFMATACKLNTVKQPQNIGKFIASQILKRTCDFHGGFGAQNLLKIHWRRFFIAVSTYKSFAQGFTNYTFALLALLLRIHFQKVPRYLKK